MGKSAKTPAVTPDALRAPAAAVVPGPSPVADSPYAQSPRQTAQRQALEGLQAGGQAVAQLSGRGGSYFTDGKEMKGGHGRGKPGSGISGAVWKEREEQVEKTRDEKAREKLAKKLERSKSSATKKDEKHESNQTLKARKSGKKLNPVNKHTQPMYPPEKK